MIDGMTETPSTRSARGISIRELRARCQATAPAPERETFTGKRARFFSIYLTKLFLATPITPNQITALSVLVFFCGVSLFLPGGRWPAVAGALLVFFATVLDGCDGEVARFRASRNPVGGMFVEPVSHDIQYGLMFLPLGIAATQQTGSWVPLVFAFLATSGKLMHRLLDNRWWFMTRPVLSASDIKDLRQTYAARPKRLRFVSWLKRNLLTSNGMILPLLAAAAAERVDVYVYFYGGAYPLLWLLVFLRRARALGTVQVVGAAEKGAAE